MSSSISRRTVLQGAIGGGVLLGNSLLTGCGAKSSGGAGHGGVLRVGLVGGGPFDDITDPKLAQTDPGFARMQALYDALGRLDENFSFENQLAESFEPNADASSWTVRIRKGVEFHNGKTLTADDIIASFRRAVDPRDPAIMAGSLLPYIDPARISKLDQNTVRFDLKASASFFPERVSNWGLSITPSDFDPAKPVGTGAFKFVGMVPGDRSVYERFNNYWGTKAKVERLEIIDFSDSAAATNALLAGQVDAVGRLPSSDFRTIVAGGAKLLVAKNASLPGFAMRTDMAPFSDVRVREAFRLLVDRKQMVSQALMGHGALGNDMLIPSGSDYPSSLPQRVYDPEKAKWLLAAAGYVDLKMRLPSPPGHQSWASLAPEQFRAGGVKLSMAVEEKNTFMANDYLKAPFSVGNSPRQSALVGIASTLFTKSLNATHWDEVKTTALFNEAMRTINVAARDELVREIQKIQYEQGGYINWGFADIVDGVGAHVSGFKDASGSMVPLNNFIFTNISVS